MAGKQPAKKAPSGGSDAKNKIVAAIALVAIIGAAGGLYMYNRPAPPPPTDTNVMTNATPEEQKALEVQKENQLKLEKKLKPAGA
jgi:hypothetical protein